MSIPSSRLGAKEQHGGNSGWFCLVWFVVFGLVLFWLVWFVVCWFVVFVCWFGFVLVLLFVGLLFWFCFGFCLVWFSLWPCCSYATPSCYGRPDSSSLRGCEQRQSFVQMKQCKCLPTCWTTASRKQRSTRAAATGARSSSQKSRESGNSWQGKGLYGLNNTKPTQPKLNIVTITITRGKFKQHTTSMFVQVYTREEAQGADRHDFDIVCFFLGRCVEGWGLPNTTTHWRCGWCLWFVVGVCGLWLVVGVCGWLLGVVVGGWVLWLGVGCCGWVLGVVVGVGCWVLWLGVVGCCCWVLWLGVGCWVVGCCGWVLLVCGWVGGWLLGVVAGLCMCLCCPQGFVEGISAGYL